MKLLFFFFFSVSGLSPFNKAVLCLGSTFTMLSFKKRNFVPWDMFKQPQESRGVPVVFANASHRVGWARDSPHPPWPPRNILKNPRGGCDGGSSGSPAAERQQSCHFRPSWLALSSETYSQLSVGGSVMSDTLQPHGLYIAC